MIVTTSPVQPICWINHGTVENRGKKIFKNILKNTAESWCFTADFCCVIIDIAKESTGSNLRRWYGRDILLFRAQQDIWTGHLYAARRR